MARLNHTARLPGAAFWCGKRVFITGHTGFKGGWLALLLRSLGAEVWGYALPPPTTPSFFAQTGLENFLHHTIGDVRDMAQLTAAMQAAQPAVIIHLAAQALVRQGYDAPVETFAVNVMGTVHVLAAARNLAIAPAILVVTSDKCYRPAAAAHREDDALGGPDPYSASKAAAEMVAQAYAQSFGLNVATARAGNVIGGGDWATARLLPDLMRAFAAGLPAVLRAPAAVRPWQHVLDPLCGYLLALEDMAQKKHPAPAAWNFGPDADKAMTVAALAVLAAQAWGAGAATIAAAGDDGKPEAAYLALHNGKARHELGWAPALDCAAAVQWTIQWYRAAHQGQNPLACAQAQIQRYLGHDPAS